MGFASLGDNLINLIIIKFNFCLKEYFSEIKFDLHLTSYAKYFFGQSHSKSQTVF